MKKKNELSSKKNSKKGMNLKAILDYRVIAMGLSMIMIMTFHSDLPIISNTFVYRNLHIGVDCFLFLSGLGIVQSLNKNDNIKEYYKRRLLRILPTTIPLIIIYSYLLLQFHSAFNNEDFYLQITSLNFWLNKGTFPLFMWYIPCIMLYYFASPFIYKWLKNNISDKRSILIVSIVILLLFLVPAGTDSTTVINIFCRFPIFLLGMIYGFRIINEDRLKFKEFLFIVLLAGISTLAIRYLEIRHFQFLCYIPIVLTIIITISFISDRFKIKGRVIKIIGESTLAIYCSHEFIKLILLGAYYKYNLASKIAYNAYLFSLFFAVLGLAVGISYTKFIKYLLKKN